MTLIAPIATTRHAHGAAWIGGITAIMLAILTAAVWLTEPLWDGVALALAAFGILSAGVFALSRRIMVSAAVAGLVFVLIWISAEFKYAVMAMNLHVYDAALYLTAWSKYAFFIATFPRQSLIVGILLLTTLLILMLLWWAERPWPMRLGKRFLLVLTMALITAAAAWPYQGRNVQFFMQRSSVFSAFFASMGDLPDLIRFEGGMRMTKATAHQALPGTDIMCRPGADAPDIVLFLHESAMPPGVYPDIRYPTELRPFFTSGDGLIRPLRVETFGGGTWLTDFSALTGLATRGFGSLQTFAGQLMTGRIRHSLPQYLKACGYDTTMIYPTDADFAGTRQFYQSIGFDRVIDADVHRAPDGRQPDAFYLDLVARQMTAPADPALRRPQFIVASSMASHGPWDFPFDPTGPDAGKRWNADAEMDEYLRRLLAAQRDQLAFRQKLQATLPARRILYVDYGDHQPSLAAMPLKQATAIADKGLSWQMDPASKGFETYYRITAQGFRPAYPAATIPILEAAHLPIVTIMAAGLPLDAVMAERARLLTACRGLYSTCADAASVTQFQRWMADSGWIGTR
jgi:hypothetical protein